MIKCALSLLIIATCIVGIFADDFCEKQKKLDSECAKYCYQVAKPLLQMAPICHQKDQEITQLNSKVADMQNKLSVYEERERKSLEEGTKCNEINTKLADLQNELVVYKERERKSKEEENKYNELNEKFNELNKKLAVFEYRERKGFEEGNKCNELNDKLSELPRILLNLEEREKKDIEEINLSKQLNVQLGKVQEKLATCEEREKKCIVEINLNKKDNVQLGEVQEKLANCEEREEKSKEINSKDESSLKASLEEYRKKLSELESSNLALNISNQEVKEDLKQFNKYSKYNNSCLKQRPGVDTTGTVEIEGMEAFAVSCVNNLNSGPGWMLIQKRNKKAYGWTPWSTYRNGRSNSYNGFFIGLEKLYRLTNAEPHELYIDMEDSDGNKKFAHYDNFRVGTEWEQYPLKDLGNYTPDSNAFDVLRDNNNMKFSTVDRDNDNSPDINCAHNYNSGWWHNTCTKAKGYYLGTNENDEDGLWWLSTEVKLENVRMLIRPKVKK